MYRHLLSLFFVLLLALSGCEKAEVVGTNQKAITKIANGYQLAVPSEIASEVEERQNVKLTLRHPEKGDLSVQGRLARASSGGLILRTQETLNLPPDVSNSTIVFHEPNTPAGNCFAPEFGIGCFFAYCIGTTYCLPGDGPGGFTCRCLQ